MSLYFKTYVSLFSSVRVLDLIIYLIYNNDLLYNNKSFIYPNTYLLEGVKHWLSIVNTITWIRFIFNWLWNVSLKCKFSGWWAKGYLLGEQSVSEVTPHEGLIRTEITDHPIPPHPRSQRLSWLAIHTFAMYVITKIIFNWIITFIIIWLYFLKK